VKDILHRVVLVGLLAASMLTGVSILLTQLLVAMQYRAPADVPGTVYLLLVGLGLYYAVSKVSSGTRRS
jgi:hypothetical protein